MKKYISIIIAASLFVSCEKVIDIDLNTSIPQIVIEGNISDEPGPYTVKLSKTVNYNDKNIYPPVTGAFVIISDNAGVTDTLTETVPGLYQTHGITGIQGNTYTLKVIAEGKQYEAVSTMPYKVNLDSIQFNLYSEPGESEKTLAVVPLYLDPIEFGNSYRFFFSANGIEDKTYQVGNDNIGNGRINQQPFFSEDVKFHNGDTVKVTMLCIDVNAYNYYYTLSQIGGGGLVGGSTPSNPPGNIFGDNALGIFSAYTTQTKTVIAK
ncbi:MAG: hypothetical protein A2068_12390 [Ignavibacteria bacterium GWB2_35_6b]|nr:MAG: hypothetical protein A2068_12390 [Ignavibacteria bacterium GWB2_35_6b]